MRVLHTFSRGIIIFLEPPFPPFGISAQSLVTFFTRQALTFCDEPITMMLCILQPPACLAARRNHHETVSDFDSYRRVFTIGDGMDMPGRPDIAALKTRGLFFRAQQACLPARGVRFLQ